MSFEKKHFYTPCVGLSVYMRSSHHTYEFPHKYLWVYPLISLSFPTHVSENPPLISLSFLYSCLMFLPLIISDFFHSYLCVPLSWPWVSSTHISEFLPLIASEFFSHISESLLMALSFLHFSLSFFQSLLLSFFSHISESLSHGPEFPPLISLSFFHSLLLSFFFHISESLSHGAEFHPIISLSFLHWKEGLPHLSPLR